MGETRKRRPQRLANDSLRKELCKVYVAGASIRALSDRTGLGYGTVHRIISDAGVLRSHGGHRGDSTPLHVVAMIAALPIAPIAKSPTESSYLPADVLAAIMKDYAADAPIHGLAVLIARRNVLRLVLADLDAQISTLEGDALPNPGVTLRDSTGRGEARGSRVRP